MNLGRYSFGPLHIGTFFIAWCFSEVCSASAPAPAPALERCQALTKFSQPEDATIRTIEDIGDSTQGGTAEIILVDKTIVLIKAHFWGEVGSHIYEFHFYAPDSPRLYDLRVQKLFYDEPLSAEDVEVVAEEVQIICRAGEKLNFPAQSDFSSEYGQAQRVLREILAALDLDTF